MTDRSPEAVKRAALVYALRSGWTERERNLDLSEAEEMVTELLDAYEGRVDGDLISCYGAEFDMPPSERKQAS